MAEPLCSLCSSPAHPCFDGKTWRISPAGRSFAYASCDTCRVLFCTPQPTEDELVDVYANYYRYAWFTSREWLKRMQAWHRYRRMRSTVLAGHPRGERGRWLDVGCGHGWFLDQVKRDGWEAHGLEILDEASLEQLQQRGLHIEKGTLPTCSFGSESFDVVTLWHTLEHVPDPRAALARVAKLLTPRGVCIIAVPNRDAWGLRRAGVSWGWLQEPFVHLHCFSAQTLRSIKPDQLEVKRVHSRDTWDQQYIMYTWGFTLWRALCRLLFLSPRWVFNRVGWKHGAQCAERIHMVFQELGALATYAIYLLLRPLLRSYEQGLHGSELLVALRKSA